MHIFGFLFCGVGGHSVKVGRIHCERFLLFLLYILAVISMYIKQYQALDWESIYRIIENMNEH